jgi:hypothetical protein
MERPRSEEFILDVQRSARTLRQPTVEADSNTVETDAIAKILHRAALWLTPKVVEHYHPEDFTQWRKEQQDRLRQAVEEYRNKAKLVLPDKPANFDQYMEGANRTQSESSKTRRKSGLRKRGGGRDV